MTNKKVLIAGVAGFLGSHLADSLIASGLKVVGIDDWTTGNKENIKHLKGNSLFDFIETNINQKIPDALFDEEWVAIIHTANTEVTMPGTRMELNELLSNSFGVKNLLDLALRTKSRFVLTSTIDLYRGLASRTSVSHYFEDSEVSSILSYAEAKRYAEALCQEYATIYGMDIRIARLSETYGPRMNLNTPSLLSRLITAGLKGESLALEEIGSRMLYATYYSDVVFGLNKLAVRDDISLRDGIFYLVNDEQISVISVVLTIKELSPEQVSIEFLPRVEQPLFELPDIDLSRSRNELYWESKVSLRDGIKRTFEFFSEHAEYLKQEKPLPVKALQVEEESQNNKESPKKVEPVEIPEAESEPQPQVEEELVQDIIEDSTEKLEAPALEEPHDTPQLKSPSRWLSLKNRTPHFPIKGVSTKKHKTNRIKLIILIVLLAVGSWFIGLPVVGILGNALLTKYHVSRAQSALESAHFQSASQQLDAATSSLENVHTYWGKTGWFWTILRQHDSYDTVSQVIEAGNTAIKASYWGVNFVNDTQPWWGPLVRGEDAIEYSQERSPERLAKSELSWRFFRQNIELSNQIYAQTLNKPLFRLVRNGVNDSFVLLQKAEAFTKLDSESWNYLPQWLGYQGPQNAVILLQNNHEIRAGGGFIGSYALVTLENGVVSKLLIDDIYNPDGQLDQDILKTLSPAPDPVKTYFKTEGLGLRDSNWWPHFPQTGSQFARLYKEATGINPQWIIGIDLKVVEDLLSVVGSITLPGTNEPVEPSSLFEKAEIASEVNFEPGSRGKKDFLTEVAQQIWLSLFPLPEDKLASVASSFISNVLGGDIQAYATVSEWQDVIENTAIAGAIPQTSGDYLSVISSNVGGNKANYWVTRTEDYSIFVDRNGKLRAKLTIFFNHSGETESWPNGLYRDYLRVYVPEGAVLAEATGFSGESETYTEFGKTVFAGLVEVPVNNSQEITLSYALPDSITLSANSPYTLYVDGQVGLSTEMFTLRMGLPLYLKYANASPSAKIDDDQLVWEKDINNFETFFVTVSEQQ